MKIPEEWLQATDDYETATDTIGQFLYECCTTPDDEHDKPVRGYFTASTDLYHAFENWWKLTERADPMKIMEFIQELQARGFKHARRKMNGKQTRGIDGLALLGVVTMQAANDAPVSDDLWNE